MVLPGKILPADDGCTGQVVLRSGLCDRRALSLRPDRTLVTFFESKFQSLLHSLLILLDLTALECSFFTLNK